MNDSASKDGPALTGNVSEVQGYFPTDAMLQGALGQLTLQGYDRADFSLPEEQTGGTFQTPNEGAENPVDQTDKSQLRTMGTSMAGYAGAVAVAGLTLATGGAAGIAAAAAAAVGAGSAVAANATGQAVDKANTASRDERGAEGKLILAVRILQPAQIDEVSAIMKQAGATRVEAVARGEDLLTAGVSSASWTGG